MASLTLDLLKKLLILANFDECLPLWVRASIWWLLDFRGCEGEREKHQRLVRVVEGLGFLLLFFRKCLPFCVSPVEYGIEYDGNEDLPTRIEHNSREDRTASRSVSIAVCSTMTASSARHTGFDIGRQPISPFSVFS